MPTEQSKPEKLLCVDNLRHAEYYGMQKVFDGLYADSLAGKQFANLMELILSRENILLAYRNIKTNTGSNTAGTDRLIIKDIGQLSPQEVVDKVRFIVSGSPHGYRPRAVRRKDIPKPYDPTKTRPLGIPCIWDRLIQQSIKQVLEPICEARFSENSYGFRPNRSVEHAIERTYRFLQLTRLHYVIEFDIKGFFDNVNHEKLIRQIWALGIRDKHLIYVLRRILSAPVKMPDGKMVIPTRGTPQGGIISPLLANIVLNELDHWIDSQWQNNPIAIGKGTVRRNGYIDKSNGYRKMKSSALKEIFIVRYADDFRIFCRTMADAEKTKIATTQWLSERLKLEISEEKTRIVNVERQHTEFLGFKIKVVPKGHKLTVQSHISDKQLANKCTKLVEQAKRVARPRNDKTELSEIRLYNSMVMGIQNYYSIATCVNLDCAILHRAVMTIFTNRLRSGRGHRLVRKGRKLTEVERRLYGKSNMLRFCANSDEPIYPIAYIRHKNPMAKKRSICAYSPNGRKGLHDDLRINTSLMMRLMRQTLTNGSAEFADNRISLFSTQWGKCAVTGRAFQTPTDIHCHHKLPRQRGGGDNYGNLVLMLEPVHYLIHATCPEVIDKFLFIVNPSPAELKKINCYREDAGLPPLKI